MFLIRRIKCCISTANTLTNGLRSFCFYDKNLNHFRQQPEYKNLIVSADKDWSKFKSSISSELSFKVKDDVQSDGFFDHFLQRETVMKLTTSEVRDILSLMANNKVDTNKYAMALKYLDEKCALSAERLPLDLSFYLMDNWLMIWGGKTFKRHYYSAISSQWSRRIEKCSPFNLILVLYFIGMSKSAQPFLMDSVIDRMESKLSSFSDEEIALACLSFFKCSRRIKSTLFLQRSCEAAETLLKNGDHFNAISILKCLRLSKHYDAKLWDAAKNFAVENSSSLNLVSCTNFLALFATQSVYDRELFNSLEKQASLTLRIEEEDGMSELSIKTHPSLRSRVKDVARLLWSLTTVGHPVNDNTLLTATSFVEKRLELGEYESQLHILIDTLQSFVLANYYPKNIFSSVLNLKTYNRICNSDKAKPKYQLLFVEKSVMIEQSDIPICSKNITSPIPKYLEMDIKERKGFKELLEFLKRSFPKSYKSCYIIPHIMIAGIIFAKACSTTSDTLGTYHRHISNGIVSNQVHELLKNNHEYFCIEILDSSVCCGEDYHPIGLMQTKMRQLKALGFTVIALTNKDIDNVVNNSLPKEECDIRNLFKT